MTTDQRTPELTAMERVLLDAYEAQAYDEDALRERMAVAICEADADVDDELWSWQEAGEDVRDAYRRMADAALAVVRTPVEAER